MLELQPLRQDQYKQAAEWEWGPQDEDINWQRYEAEMDAPKWAHFGLYDGADFVGRVSIEKIDQLTVAYHVVTARHKVHPQALAQVLLKMAGWLFKQGFTALIAQIPQDNHAAAKLAIRCGMKEQRQDGPDRYFIMTIEELIQEARERVTRDPAQREAERRQQEEQRRLTLTTEAVSRIDASLPEPLRPHVVYAGEDPGSTPLEKWFPVFFKIETPRLAPMSFTVRLADPSNPAGPLRVDSIRVGTNKFGADWDAAIVEADGPSRESLRK